MSYLFLFQPAKVIIFPNPATLMWLIVSGWSGFWPALWR